MGKRQPAAQATWSTQLGKGAGSPAAARWHGRPRQAAAVQAVAFLVPILASLVVAVIVSRVLPDPTSSGERVGGWLVVLAVSSAVLWGAERLARRLLPLATLLRMSMLFPDKAPSRYKVARQVNSTKTLQERIDKARAAGRSDEPAQAAAAILELVAALHTHDRHTRGHAERVRVYADMIAEELGLRREQADRLRWASLLHDIGKLAVPAEILNKPGKPTDAEWERLQAHPEAGLRFLGSLTAWLGEWAQTIPQHHEQWDGSGYPRGLAGTEIHLGARIVAVADSYEVMTAGRPYKKAMSPAAAREELLRCAGSQFDPTVVRALLQISIGRLRWAMGPLSWVATLPFLPQLAHASPVAHVTSAIGSGASNMAVAGALTATAIVQPAPLVDAVDRLVALTPAPVEAVLLSEDTSPLLDPPPVPGEPGQPGPPACAGHDDTGDKPGCGDERRAEPAAGGAPGGGAGQGHGREHAPGQQGRDAQAEPGGPVGGPPGQAGRDGEGPPGQAGREGPPGQAGREEGDPAEPAGNGNANPSGSPDEPAGGPPAHAGGSDQSPPGQSSGDAAPPDQSDQDEAGPPDDGTAGPGAAPGSPGGNGAGRGAQAPTEPATPPPSPEEVAVPTAPAPDVSVSQSGDSGQGNGGGAGRDGAHGNDG